MLLKNRTMIARRASVLGVLTLTSLVQPSTATCPRSCDCSDVIKGGQSQIDVRCFVRDLNELDITALSNVKKEFVLTVSCASASPFDITSRMFGFNSYMRGLVMNNCKIAYIHKQAFHGLLNLNMLHIHSASNHYVRHHPEALAFLTHLTSLALTGSGVMTMPNLCSMQSLKSLNLSGNSLISFIMAGLNCSEGSLNELSVLDISRNLFQNLNELAVYGQAFKELESMIAAENRITLNDDAASLVNFKRLRVLDLSLNNISTISQSIFKENTNLQDLNISWNKLEHLPEGIFSRTEKMLRLEMRNNVLGDSVWVGLAGVTSLIYLDLSHNNLTSLNQTTLAEFREINTLNLKGNKISELAEGTFQNHIRLQSLNLANNQIHNITARAFQSLISLERIELQENKLLSVDMDLFMQTTLLKFVNVSSNYLSKLPSLLKLGYLKILDASRNFMETLDEGALVAQGKIETINLSRNVISKLPDSLFVSCTSLVYLDLSNNTLKYLHPSLFMNSGIRTLCLQHNELQDVGKSLAMMPSLQELNLSHNRVRDTVQKSMFPASIKMLDLSHNNIVTVRPKGFDGLSDLRIVDLRFNQISTLTKDAFQVSTSLYSQTGFMISDNPLECDCNLLWLRQWDQSTQGPIIVNLNVTWCRGAYNYPEAPVKMVPVDRFLCKYDNVCTPDCMCCAFACDCKYLCPPGCDCYHSTDMRSVHIVECKSKNTTDLHQIIPVVTTKLDYSGSAVDVVPNKAFQFLGNMEELWLNNTSLKILSEESFIGLSMLKKLYLNFNEITFLRKDMFVGLSSLHELYLDNNKLTSLPDGVFSDLRSLKVLTLGQNYLKDMTSYLSQLLFSMDLTLYSNRWDCSCILYFSAREKASKFVSMTTPALPGVFPVITCALFSETGRSGRMSLREFGEKCNGQVFIPSKTGRIEELTTESKNISGDANPYHDVLDTNSPSDDRGVSVRDAGSGVWDDQVKIFLPAMIAGTIVFIAIILLACRREIVRCWLYTKFNSKSSDLYLLDDKARHNDAFIAYHYKDEAFVMRELVQRLESRSPKYFLRVQHRDRPPSTSELTFISKSVTSSHRTIVVLSNDFTQDSALLKCVSQCVRQDSLDRLITVSIGHIDKSKLDAILLYHMKHGKHLSFGENWFWDKLYYCLPEPRASVGEIPRAEAHPYASTDLARMACAEKDNKGYHGPFAGHSRELPNITEYNLPSLNGYGYGGSQQSSNIYEEIKDIYGDETCAKYSVPWNDDSLHQNVRTLSRSMSVTGQEQDTQIRTSSVRGQDEHQYSRYRTSAISVQPDDESSYIHESSNSVPNTTADNEYFILDTGNAEYSIVPTKEVSVTEELDSRTQPMSISVQNESQCSLSRPDSLSVSGQEHFWQIWTNPMLEDHDSPKTEI
ncbi:toll-like receptor Tollo [Dreissena polymorpha]|uniref:TIR domain-containing protein n=1 Tax=Dreissena polymorpha TaxID=45954 RepID=A0A9D4HY87_DREPO|nr:toll-like receptor Tollo [Dreissena polymorpha]KAH3737289.1 hypothetical protein DPMN_043872 [Dreissena polymorpha]